MFEGIEPTQAERLLIWRRREGKSQGQAAKEHGVSHRRWGLWERGLERAETDKPVTTLTLPEKLLLHRRRKGLSQDQVAATMNCTRAWIQAMESGLSGTDDLVEFWRNYEG